MARQKKETSDFIILNHNPTETLIPALETHLPSSLPILRRIQYDIAHPRRTAYYVASANITQSSDDPKDEEPWMAAYINLFTGHETQVWIYSSLEADVAPIEHTINSDNDEEICDFSSISPDRQDIARKQIWNLLQFIHRDLMPEYMSHLSSSENQAKVLEQAQKIKVIPKHSPPSILLGSLHTGLIKLLTTNNSYLNAQFRPGLKVHRYDALPYVKYIFATDIFQTGSEEKSNPLPEGYYYGSEGLSAEHVDLVKSRTHIPRERETLLAMPSVVVYQHNNADVPIAWGFLAFDGSLATLHVEPEHRGKGIAATLSREIMRRGMRSGVYGSDSKELGYAHADVARNNVASRRVMEKVGGGKGWRWSVTWSVVEVVEE
jgi:GNAT superfamily N-acetyltransferase